MDLTPRQWGVWNGLCDTLRTGGIDIVIDQSVARSIRKAYRVGKHTGGLELVTECHRALIRFEFFQNVANVENPAGGRYDFEKRQRMPYLIGLRFEWARRKMFAFLESIGGRANPAKMTSPVADPLGYFNESWSSHYGPGSRDDTGWPSFEHRKSIGFGRSAMDRDGQVIATGGLYWHRLDNGRLVKGRAYPQANGQWLIVYGSSSDQWTIVHDGKHLFMSRGSETLRRRVNPIRALIKMNEAKKQAVAAEKYERAAMLRDAIARKKAKNQ